MDSKLLASALCVDFVGIVVFGTTWSVARDQTSVSSIAMVAVDAIIAFAMLVIIGLALLVLGIIRRRPVTPKQVGMLGVGSFVLGAFSLFYAFVSLVGYSDELAACGGFPPGYWTTGNVTVNRCSVFVSVHEDWVSYVFWAILLAASAIFIVSVWVRVRLTSGERASPSLLSSMTTILTLQTRIRLAFHSKKTERDQEPG